MNKKIFFILLINYFISVTYAEHAAQEGQTSTLSMLKSMNFNQKTQKSLDDQTNENDPLGGRLQAEKPLNKQRSYLSPTQSSKASKKSPEEEWSNSLRSEKTPTAAKNNRETKEQSDNKKTPVPNASTKGPVKFEVSKPNSSVLLKTQKRERNEGIAPKEPSVSDNQTKAQAYLKDLLAEESPVTNFLKKVPVKNVPLENEKINKKEEILKKIMQLDQEIVAIANQIIKFEHYTIKEKMDASDREELKKPMKKFQDEKIAAKKKLETEFRNLEEKIPEKSS